MFKSPNREGSKSTHQKGTKLYAAHILNILEKYSGVKSTGEILFLKVSGDSIDKNGRNSIQYYLKQYYAGCKIDRNTITGILNDLCGIDHEFSDLPAVKCVTDSSGSRVLGYYIDTPKLDEGEFTLLASMIQYAPFLKKTTKEAMQKKILTLTKDENYSKTVGKVQIDAKNDRLKSNQALLNVEAIHKASSINMKISFAVNEYLFDKQLHRVETETDIIFSPYEIIPSNNYVFVVGKKNEESVFTHYRVDKLSNIVILNERFDRRDAIDTQKYIDEHPFMINSHQIPCRVTILINENALSDILDEFGLNVEIRKWYKEGYLQVNISATESDVFQWALMHADVATVLDDDSEISARLRRDLRRVADTTTEKYIKTAEDRYWAKVDRCKASWIKDGEHKFACGLDLSNKTEFHELKELEYIAFSEGNNVKDISFITGYPKLKVFKNAGNFIEDYSPLSSVDTLEEIWIANTEIKSLDFLKNIKNLKRLHLNLNTILDYSALYTTLNIDCIVLGKKEQGYIDINLVKSQNPTTTVRDVFVNRK